MKELIYKVYGLIHPLTNKICYVGVTRQKLSKRLYQHNNPKKENSSYVAKAKRSLKEQKFEIVLLRKFDNEEDMYNYEIFLIKHFREIGHKLYNLQKGGIEGTNPPKSVSKMLATRQGNNKWKPFRGEEAYNSVLTTEDILKIYNRIKEFKSNQEIMKEFNIKSTHISSIRRGTLWNHLWKKHLNMYIPSIKDSVNSTEDKIKIIELFNKGYTSYEVHKLYPNINRFDLERVQRRELWKTVWRIFDNYSTAHYNSNIINESGEFGGSLKRDNTEPSPLIGEGVTTIPEMGVHSSEWKRQTPQVGDDIVCSYGRP